MGKNDRYVQPRDDGKWEVVKPRHERASAVRNTQRQAEHRAKTIVGNAGGGEVRIKDQRGRIRDSDTVPPAKDPNPPKDRRH
jgi:Uncharacterized protein conserved in bacteria (DUF2188)